MSASAWYTVAIIGFSLAGAFLIASVILFVKLKIPAVIGDLSGRTVAREIDAIRNANITTGDKHYRPGRINAERGKLTELMGGADGSAMAMAHMSKRLDRAAGSAETGSRRSGTVGLSDMTGGSYTGARRTDILEPAAKGKQLSTLGEITASLSDTTDILADNRTEVLTDNRTEVLADNRTEVLTDTEAAALPRKTQGGTTVLSQSESVPQAAESAAPAAFRITRRMIEVHTDEVVE